MLRVTQLIGFGSQAAAPAVGTKTLSAGGASYSIAGTAATLVASIHGHLMAAAGSYSLTGTAANVTVAGTEAAAFLARTSGLDTTHTNAYTALINGLVADGVWSKLDVLHIYATQNTATAQLNLVSTSFPATVHGAPTFTADRGYQGTEGSTTIYIDTGFNPTSGTPHFVTLSAHISSWQLTNGAGTASVGASDGSNSYPIPRLAGDLFYVRINSAASSITVASTDSRGHFIVNRSGSTATQGYKNGASVVTSADPQNGKPNLNLYSIGWNSGGTPNGYGQQEAMISFGSSLSSTDATAFYGRLRTYMTAVGVP